MTRFVVMGVAGCGKTTIGTAFAKAVGAEYIDGDDLHPPANIAKMTRGHALDDDDRAPWLASIAAVLGAHDGPVVVGCSALKRRYRDQIRAGVGGPVTFLHLAGSREVIAQRMAERSGHFMPTSLIDSQFAALEPPGDDEAAVSVDIDQPPDQILKALLRAVAARRS